MPGVRCQLLSPRYIYRVKALFSPIVQALNPSVQKVMCRPINDRGNWCKNFFLPFSVWLSFFTIYINRAPYETFKNAAIFSRFVMVPRLLAAARAMRSCTCADVIQPCSFPEFNETTVLSRQNWQGEGERSGESKWWGPGDIPSILSPCFERRKYFTVSFK